MTHMPSLNPNKIIFYFSVFHDVYHQGWVVEELLLRSNSGKGYQYESGHKGGPVFVPPLNEVGGEYTGFTLSVRPSIRLSVDDMVSGA